MGDVLFDLGVLALIKQWLKAPVIGEDDNGVKKTVGGGKANRRGTPQGGVISPLLVNCYLHILDRLWQRRHLKGRLQAHIVRYADDFVVLCRKDVEALLERLDLSLNEAKTRIVDATQASFNFLGFAIQMSRGGQQWKTVPECSTG